MSLKRLFAVLFAAALLVPVAIAALPANASNKGDVWATNSPDAGAGHAHEPHLSCGTIYLHGSDLADAGTYTIDSIPPSGSGLQVWSGTWSTPSSGDVIATLSGSALVAAAVNLDNATPNVNQGYHFKLDLSQEGVKHKTFWVRCTEQPPSPSLGVTKTADDASVVSGDDIGFTITVGPDEGSFADDVALSDPLPKSAGIDWFIDPAYAGPGTCTIAGSAPGQQTLHCSLGDMGAPENPVSATVHVASHTIAGTTAADGNITIDNTATATADDLDPVHASASIFIDPASPRLAITKTADAPSVTVGSSVGFTILVTNHGSGVAHNATLSDPLPGAAGTVWSISPVYGGPGSCTITGSGGFQTLGCSFGALAAGGSVSVHISSSTTAAGTLTNVAAAKADDNPTVTGTAQVVVDPVGGASVLGTTSSSNPTTSSSTPTTQVLGLRLSKPNAAVLPVTGGPPMWLLAPGLALLGIGAEVLVIARRRLAVRA